MNETDTEKYTTIFLADKSKPTCFHLLRRSPNKKFAPNLFTGFGGKVEVGETHVQGAYRELTEETGLTQIKLKEFGRIIINQKKILYQFSGLYIGEPLVCNEGRVETVPVAQLAFLPLIPTAKIFLEAWEQRNWRIKEHFTLLIERENLEDIYSPILSIEALPGLIGK